MSGSFRVANHDVALGEGFRETCSFFHCCVSDPEYQDQDQKCDNDQDQKGDCDKD